MLSLQGSQSQKALNGSPSNILTQEEDKEDQDSPNKKLSTTERIQKMKNDMKAKKEALKKKEEG
jgi:hypothetical protein